MCVWFSLHICLYVHVMTGGGTELTMGGHWWWRLRQRRRRRAAAAAAAAAAATFSFLVAVQIYVKMHISA